MKTKRILATVGVVVTAGIAPLMVASPASANVNQCAGIVATYGYDVGPKVKAACAYHATLPPVGDPTPHPLCLLGLEKIGVREAVAKSACKWA
jgi:hypothetical protein